MSRQQRSAAKRKCANKIQTHSVVITAEDTPRPQNPRPSEIPPGLSLPGAPRVSRWRVAEACSIVASLIAFGFLLRPSLSAQANAPFGPEQPFSAPFKFTNTGALTIRNLRFNVDLDTAQFHTDPGSTLTLYPMPEATLLPGESVEEFVPIGYGADTGGRPAIRFLGAPTSTDLRLIAHFYVAIWPFEITRVFRFASLRDSEGHFRWIQIPRNAAQKDWISIPGTVGSGDR